MADRVPENALLSHDLFEGVFARAGLVTDVELFEEFPSNYLVSTARQHRWARGDWQLLPWILGRAHDATGRHSRSSIPAIARWKMIDNLRRTMSAPLTLATLIAAWTLPSVSTGLWTAFVLAAVLVRAALPVLAGLLPRRQGISKRSHMRAVGADVALAAAQVGLGFTLLAHQAWLMVDAILRTLARLYATRRNLLEWTTAAQAKASHDLDLAGFYRPMAGGVAVAAATAILVLAVKPGAVWIAAPFVALWLLSPLVARRVSLPPPVSAAVQLSASDVGALRLTARRTWRFFETFVGPEDHGLPPDNFQDDPKPVVAHRTSPTNIGMYLLATVTARDFGWIGTLEMVERLEATLATIGRLERFRGHLYNWYDTRDLHRLEPAYVSSVDSGNLAGHLLALSNACRQMIDQPLPVAAALAGIGDALALTREAAGAIGDDRRSQTLTRRHLDEALELPAGAGRVVPATPEDWAARLAELSAHARTLSDVAAALTAERGEGADGELVTWAEAARLAATSHARDLALEQPGPQMTAFRTIAELADPPVHETGDGSPPAALLVRRLQAISDQAQQLFRETDFAFLFDPTRKLFSIGFRVRDGTLDPSYYDLLASEARLASFLAIAKGDIAPDHWFRLGRALTPVGRGSALISWSGSMFEYLMPALVMRAPALSLLDHTYRLVVARQMSYAAELRVPWGISESGFNARDLEQTYQYSSFGVPGLGLKRGLSGDVVVAPYATALGAMIRPEAAVENFTRLSKAGAGGRYGFREALDYTARRLPEGAPVAIVNSYMAPTAESLDEMTRLVGANTEPQQLVALNLATAFNAFGTGRLDDARTAWHRAAELSIEYLPVSMARAARAALWAGDVAGAGEDLAALDAAGVHGPAIVADRQTIQAGIAALDGRSAEAIVIYRNALHAWRDLGLAWDEALCGLDMALLLDPADPDVRAAADAARDILVRLGAAPFIARLEAALAAPPVSQPPPERSLSGEPVV